MAFVSVGYGSFSWRLQNKLLYKLYDHYHQTLLVYYHMLLCIQTIDKNICASLFSVRSTANKLILAPIWGGLCQYSCQKHMKISPSLMHLPVALHTFRSAFPGNDICCFKGLNHELVKFIILSRHELSSCFGYQGRWRGRGTEVLDFREGSLCMCMAGAWDLPSQ